VTNQPDPGRVFVEARARLHFGVLDLRGALGRWFGGIGAAASSPTLRLSARPAPTLAVEGPDADRAAGFARVFLAHHGLNGGTHLSIERTLPAHVGLGSGTQLALAVARAIAELYELPSSAADLAVAVGRARRSAVGTWTFDGGGIVVEGGRRDTGDAVAPLVARLPFPPAWRCIVAVPRGVPAVSGAAEEAAFASLPPPRDGEVERIAHLVLMALLPAVADDDIRSFGRALTEIQTTTGKWFAAVQGGAFAPGPSEELVHRMAEWDAAGVGQSSWGPAVYGIVSGAEPAARLADRVRGALVRCGGGDVYEGPFADTGARVWRTA
jgi:beta-ribofuranosylaminobenzene 5'-phosphate synthase